MHRDYQFDSRLLHSVFTVKELGGLGAKAPDIAAAFDRPMKAASGVA